MSIKTEFEKIIFSDRMELKDRAVKADCKLTGISDASKVISLTARVMPVSVTAADGSASFKAKALFTAIVKDGDALSEAESGVEFSADFNDERLKTGDKVYASYTVERSAVKSSNGNVVAECYVLASAYAERQSASGYLSGGEGMLIKKNTHKLGVRQGSAKGQYTAQGDLEIKGAVGGVIYSDAAVILSEAVCSDGMITVSGTVTASVIALQKRAESVIIKEIKEMPFRAELDAPGSLSNYKASGKAAVRNLKIDAIVDEDAAVTTFAISVGLDLTASIYGETEITMADDCYSAQCELTTETAAVRCISQTCSAAFNKRVSNDAFADEPISSDLSFVACVGERFTLTSTSYTDSGVTISGVCETDVITLDDGNYGKFTASMPVEETFGGSYSGKITATCAVTDVKALRKGTGLMLEGNLRVYLTGEAEESVALISKVEEGAAKTPNDSAISVYYLDSGSSMWDAAKAAGVCEAEIMESNPEVAFPLEARGKIVIYRSKRIEY